MERTGGAISDARAGVRTGREMGGISLRSLKIAGEMRTREGGCAGWGGQFVAWAGGEPSPAGLGRPPLPYRERLLDGIRVTRDGSCPPCGPLPPAPSARSAGEGENSAR